MEESPASSPKPPAGQTFLGRLSLTLGYEKRHIDRQSIDLDKYPGGRGKQLQLSDRNEIVEVSNDLDTFYSEDRIDSLTEKSQSGKSDETNFAGILRRRFTRAIRVNRNGGTPMVDDSEKENEAKLGTVMGVFVPCLQNILGVILFIRLKIRKIKNQQF